MEEVQKQIDIAVEKAMLTEQFWWLCVHADITGLPLSEKRVEELRAMPDPRQKHVCG